MADKKWYYVINQHYEVKPVALDLSKGTVQNPGEDDAYLTIFCGPEITGTEGLMYTEGVHFFEQQSEAIEAAKERAKRERRNLLLRAATVEDAIKVLDNTILDVGQDWQSEQGEATDG